ncbi:hypothetical protein Pint_16556 [Pistacia integerrima]|uniref:Uncharacterized protein n=1 Tax=Pistacia integerrima TaxID=434235 RepID=A0ACC0ZCW8_9ROSI|nr:hypothetical protein Pint_16556 [Pistacia integerrima]
MATLAMTPTNLTTDQSALLAFKANVVYARSVLTYNWSISIPVCNWVGVSCGARHGRVTALNLPHMALGRSIPSHLGNLSFLVYLDLSNNYFSGSLPNQLGQLRRLRYINLNNNKLSGDFPSWIGSLSELTYLGFYNNTFTGT